MQISALSYASGGILDFGVEDTSVPYSWIQSRHISTTTYYNIALNPAGGNVGIGTASPQSKLHVYGGEVQVGSSSASCSSANAGAIRYYSGTAYVCDGTTWDAFGGSSGGSLPSLASTDVWVGNISNVPTATPTTGTGNVVMSASPTLTGTVTAGSSTWSGNVGIGTTLPFEPMDIEITSPDTTEPTGIYGHVTDAHTAMLILDQSATLSRKSGIQFGNYLDGTGGKYAVGGLFSVMTSTANNTVGDLTFDLRRLSTDTALTEAMRI